MVVLLIERLVTLPFGVVAHAVEAVAESDMLLTICLSRSSMKSAHPEP
jgi:hypothetical protein